MPELGCVEQAYLSLKCSSMCLTGSEGGASVWIPEALEEGVVGQETLQPRQLCQKVGIPGSCLPLLSPRHTHGPVAHKGNQPPGIQQDTLMFLSCSAWQCVRCSILLGRVLSLPRASLSPSCLSFSPSPTTCSSCPHGTGLCSGKQGGRGAGCRGMVL